MPSAQVPTIQRIAIRSPAEADQPRTLRELNALHALGVVFDKHEWWTTWTKHPEVQSRWLAEMEEALVRANVSQVLAVWPHPSCVATTQGMLVKVQEVARKGDGNAKKAAIESLLAHVVYPMAAEDVGFEEDQGHNDKTEEEDDDGSVKSEDDSEDDDSEEMELEDDSQDETALDEDGNVVAFDMAVAQARATQGIVVDVIDVDDNDAMGDEEEQFCKDGDETMVAHEKKNAFGQLAWFVAMTMVREKLLALTPRDWTESAVSEIVQSFQTRSNDELLTRTCSLILAVARATGATGTCSLETVASHVPEETRPSVLGILQLHFAAARELIETTKDDIVSVVDIVIRRLALPAKNEMTDMDVESLRTPGAVPHTWMSDDLISTELKNQLLREVAGLESGPELDKDFNGQELLLVDPSLYCGVIGETLRLPQSASKKMYGSPAEHMKAILVAPAKSKLAGPKGRSTKFQWLPCEIAVDEDDDGSNAAILTYINNLHPESQAGLYESIERIFTRFVPLFESVLSSLDDQADDRAYSALYELGNATLPCAPSLVPPGLFETSRPQFLLKGTRCQVAIKIAEIQLTPQKPSYSGSSWGVDGTDAERIIATGVYYFGSENISEAPVSFRTFVARPEEGGDCAVAVGLQYGLTPSQLLVQPLGSFSAREGRCVVYPNVYQHQVEPFRLEDPTKPGVCKILTFFLVDPTDKPIASTAVVPPQQEEWVQRSLAPQLKRLRLTESTRSKVSETSREGVSLEKAQETRTKLWSERAPVDHEGDWGFTFNPEEGSSLDVL